MRVIRIQSPTKRIMSEKSTKKTFAQEKRKPYAEQTEIERKRPSTIRTAVRESTKLSPLASRFDTNFPWGFLRLSCSYFAATGWEGRRGEDIRSEPPRRRGCVTAGLPAIRTLRLGLGVEAESKAEWVPPWVDRQLLAPLRGWGGVSGDTEGAVSVSQTR